MSEDWMEQKEILTIRQLSADAIAKEKFVEALCTPFSKKKTEKEIS